MDISYFVGDHDSNDFTAVYSTAVAGDLFHLQLLQKALMHPSVVHIFLFNSMWRHICKKIKPVVKLFTLLGQCDVTLSGGRTKFQMYVIQLPEVGELRDEAKFMLESLIDPLLRKNELKVREIKLYTAHL